MQRITTGRRTTALRRPDLYLALFAAPLLIAIATLGAYSELGSDSVDALVASIKIGRP